jgi:hypothetical protein
MPQTSSGAKNNPWLIYLKECRSQYQATKRDDARPSKRAKSAATEPAAIDASMTQAFVGELPAPAPTELPGWVGTYAP